MDQKREHKVVTRCGSLVEMRIKRKDGSKKWYLLRFVDEHNHEMVSEKFVNYLRSHRKISEVEIAQLTSMRGIGISISKIYESFTAQLGGFNKVSFTKQDMYNEVRKQRELQGGDVNATIKFLEGVARVDGRIFWWYKVGLDKQLRGLFWIDGRSQDNYAILGDVLAFDVTYGRNKYNLPVVVFSGICKRLGRAACMSDEDFKQYSKKLLSDAVVLEIKYGLRPTEPIVTSGTRCPNAPSHASLRPIDESVLNRMTQEVQPPIERIGLWVGILARYGTLSLFAGSILGSFIGLGLQGELLVTVQEILTFGTPVDQCILRASGGFEFAR
ncbi:hypothetical protein AHAS_Ahas16G0219100 [Arachis hypogaea]